MSTWNNRCEMSTIGTITLRVKKFSEDNSEYQINKFLVELKITIDKLYEIRHTSKGNVYIWYWELIPHEKGE